MMRVVLQPGQLLGPYRVEAELGRGGMGTVYAAHDERLDRRVALKVIAPELASDVRFATRFLREARIAARLEHPAIVPVYDAGELDGTVFIAMRLVDGHDLRQELAEHGPLEPRRLALVALHLGRALDAAHRQGLIHRDVKPGNVLLSGSGDDEHALLTDFGLAREAASDSGLTNTGQWVGTVDYVAPEQLDGGLVSARTDVYSMACLLYEAATGRLPYSGTVAVKLMGHVGQPFPGVGAAVPHAEAVDAVLARAAAKDPTQRYASAGDLARALGAALRGEDAGGADHTVATGVALAGLATDEDVEEPTIVRPRPRAPTTVGPPPGPADRPRATPTTDPWTRAAADAAGPPGGAHASDTPATHGHDRWSPDPGAGTTRVDAPRPPAPSPGHGSGGRSRVALVALGVLLVALVGVGAGLAFTAGGGKDDPGPSTVADRPTTSGATGSGTTGASTSTPTTTPSTTATTATATAPPTTTRRARTVTAPPRTVTAPPQTVTTTASPAGTDGDAWPGTSAYTAILASKRTRSEAAAYVTRARAAGLSGVGLLYSSNHSSLVAGYWVAYSGVLSQSEAGARRDQARALGFSDAYRSFVSAG